MCLGFVTEGIVRCLDRMAEVSRGHSSPARDEGLNDEKDQWKSASQVGLCAS